MTRTLFFTIAILLFLSACTAQQAPSSDPTINTNPAASINAAPTVANSGIHTEAPQSIPLNQSPPPATLTINGISQTSGVGTYCWNGTTATGESVNACADKIGIPTATDPLNAASPVKGQLTLPLSEAPNQLVLTAYQALPALELPDTVGGYRWWSFAEGFLSPLALQASQEINIKLDRGLYIFYVFAVWDGKGDVSYGFLVDVK